MNEWDTTKHKADESFSSERLTVTGWEKIEKELGGESRVCYLVNVEEGILFWKEGLPFNSEEKIAKNKFYIFTETFKSRDFNSQNQDDVLDYLSYLRKKRSVDKYSLQRLFYDWKHKRWFWRFNFLLERRSKRYCFDRCQKWSYQQGCWW